MSALLAVIFQEAGFEEILETLEGAEVVPAGAPTLAETVAVLGRHPAHLNFGDCMTYAVASLVGEPLLFTGDDFGLTDLEPVR